MAIGPALVSAGGSLLGGLLGKKPMSPARMIESHMQGIRKGAEKWGFNPLAWAGTTGAQGTAPPNYMGAAIADATASVADAWSNNAFDKAQVDQLEMQNEKMRRELNAEKIRPTVPGLYDRGGFMGGKLGASPAGGWTSAYDADWTGPQVKAPNDDGEYVSRLPERTSVEVAGVQSTPSMEWDDAEQIEKRAGDLASWGYGLGVIAADTGATLRTYSDGKGWTKPGTNYGTLLGEKLKEWVPKTKPADGYTEDGRPFWVRNDGSIRWNYE